MNRDDLDQAVVTTLESLAKGVVENDNMLLDLINALITKVERLEVDVVILRQRIESIESVNGVTH